MATHEDFSFPIFTDTFPCTIDSPPLWTLSPALSPDHSCLDREEEETISKESTEGEEEEEDYKDCFPTESIKNSTQRKSFSSFEEKLPNKFMERDGSSGDQEKEKMDMLWEDFNNEELLRRCHSSSRSSDHMVNMGCVGSLKLSKTRNKPGLVVFMKVLKKVFLLHNSHRSVQNHTSCRPVKSHTSGW